MDFTQGVEYFNTLRRLQKPVIMLEYTGENHGLRKPSNQRDYTARMKEYFDHYLDGCSGARLDDERRSASEDGRAPERACETEDAGEEDHHDRRGGGRIKEEGRR